MRNIIYSRNTFSSNTTLLIILFPVRRFILEEALGPFPFSYEPSSSINAIAHLKDIASRVVIALEVNIRTRVL